MMGNMRHVLFIVLCLGCCTFGFGLLSPLSQSVREIEAILKNHDLHRELLQSETILDIRRLDNSYIIITNQHQMVVDILYLPAKGPGPQKFELKFNTPTRIEEEA
ncbi:MAG: hypothetical protein KDK55_06340 [Chlamydiia bacterium]|nr:hypothetical protein [Chlamydiia bacterium]